MTDDSESERQARRRHEEAFQVRLRAAERQRAKPVVVQPTNGDEERYPNRIANYSKCLPHNDLGEVDLAVYDDLLRALAAGSLSELENLPTPSRLQIATPLAGWHFDLVGPDPQASLIPPAPEFSSAEAAVQQLELYWMALLRDVPFARYAEDPLVAEAAAELSRLAQVAPFFAKQSEPITAQHLFLPNYPGVREGPRVSQFLLWSYELEGMPIEQRRSVPLRVDGADGLEFLTAYDEWLWAQRGFPGTAPIGRAPIDPQRRYIYNIRDMGWYTNQTMMLGTFWNVTLMLGQFGEDAINDANPYKNARVLPSGTLDLMHGHIYARLLAGGGLELLCGQISNSHHFMYQKWVHRTLRPEVFSGRVHNNLVGRTKYPIHDTLLNSPTLARVYDRNAMLNRRRGIGDGKGTYLLPCLWGVGSPTFPSYPQGHGTASSVGATILKAWFNENFVIPQELAVRPSLDGASLEPYRYGQDGPPLTIGGELNKLAYNITWGRNAASVHTLSDAVVANAMGEGIAIDLLREDRTTAPEPFPGYTFTKFDGTKVTAS
jgi:hypothetical protein